MIFQNLIEECTELRLPIVANVPQPDELHVSRVAELAHFHSNPLTYRLISSDH